MNKNGGLSPTAAAAKATVEKVFDQFVTAVTCKSIISTFHQLLDCTGLRHADQAHFYSSLKAKLAGSWKAQALWAKIDKRAAHRDYKRGQACNNMRVLVIGAGPCGLRTAIECAFLGAKTVVVEKRDRFSRNNVLHLWPYLITDLRNLGAKKFFGKFCAGSLDHISIRQLQCILLKVALLLGVEVHVNVSFDGLVEPTQENGLGWRCKVTPDSHAVSEYVFDVLIGADGKRNTLPGFSRKEFRGKLAIAITANFINRNTQAEASVEEISGVAFIFNQKFFLDLKEKTRIDLENIVYYKDDTHYFVMTAKKASLLEKGVLKEDHADTLTLLDRSNVNQEALLSYARQAANFSTNYQLPLLDYAVNHYGQADVAMFDFTSMFAAEHTSRFILKNGHHLLMSLVGDSLLEPFWPTGSGCARGFLSAFDAAWMIRNWALGKMTKLQILAERESIYTVLSQTTPNYLHKNSNLYCLDPNTRYPNLNLKAVKPKQLKHLYEGGNFSAAEVEAEEDLYVEVPSKKPRGNADEIDSYSLLRWCQRVLNTGKYRNVHIVDFTSSWRSGLALCALIHSFRTELINVNELMECNIVENNQLAFLVAEKELGIPPVMCGADMAKYEAPDKLTMVVYLSQFYQLFKQDNLPTAVPVQIRSKRKSATSKDSDPKSPSRRVSFLQKLSARLAKSKKRKEQEIDEASPLSSKKMKDHPVDKTDVELTGYSKLPMDEIANRLQVGKLSSKIKVSKAEEMSGAISVTTMAQVLSDKFKDLGDKPAPEPIRKMKGQPSLLAAAPASEFCTFCHKRVYIMERMSAEGAFFHRGCFKCDHCYVGLRLNNYSFEKDDRNKVKFYCYRHAVPSLRLRPRKRFLEEESKENFPQTVIHPPPEEDAQQASKEKSPRKGSPSHLSNLTLPKDVRIDKNLNTPERIEFEISFDGQEEESEEEQFEHNLRASQSCDTLHDDEDSDSDSSDLDERSGAEDDVWESAGENLSPPALPLTLEEACELADTWHRAHSQSGTNSLERERRGHGRYQRLGEDGEEEEEDDDDDDDDSSTEVGESDTDDTSEEEEDSSMKAHPQIMKISLKKGSRDHGVMNPPSPSARLSASKASFFSVPPTVLSLDPFSMFGMANNTKSSDKEAEQPSEKNTLLADYVEEEENVSENSNVARQISEGSKRDELSGRDATDVSENLEYDWKSSEAAVKENGKERHISEVGSLDDLDDDFNFEERGDLGYHTVKDAASDGDMDLERGGEGDDEEEDLDDDELMEKTNVSNAMEQLLKDFDHKGGNKESIGDDRFLNISSDSGENDSFIEGRLSPSANKTRKFRMKRHARQIKGKKSKSSHYSGTSESEAGRTDPTTTDNSQPRSSLSRSPSADIQSNGVLSPSDCAIDKAGAMKEKEEDNSDEKSQIEAGGKYEGNLKEEAEPTEDSVFAERDNLKDTDIMDIETGTQHTGDDDTLRQVLESIAAMPDLSDSSDLDKLVYANIDDRFVTDRRKKKPKHTKLKLKGKDQDEAAQNRDNKTDSSFSISTPSDTETSVSSVDEEVAGQLLDVMPGDDDMGPDEDMLKDYQTTMSIALGESYSDEDQEAAVNDKTGKKSEDLLVNKKAEERRLEDRNGDGIEDGKLYTDESGKRICQKVTQSGNLQSHTSLLAPLAAEEIHDQDDTEIDHSETLLSTDSSIYATPDVSLDKRRSESGLFNNAVLCSPRDEAKRDTFPNYLRSESSSSRLGNDPSPAAPIKKMGLRDSSGSDVFLSPMESLSSPPFANVNAAPLHSSVKPVAQSSPISSPTIEGRHRTIVPDSKTSSVSSSTQPNSSSSSSSISSLSISTTSSSLIKPSPHPVPSPNITTTPHLPSKKIQRKLPELPKLKLPSLPTVKERKSPSAMEHTKEVPDTSAASQAKRNQTDLTSKQNKMTVKSTTDGVSKLNKSNVKTTTNATSKFTKGIGKPATDTTSKQNKGTAKTVSASSKQTKQEGFDRPIQSSSPKLPSKSSFGAPKITTNGRALPKPNVSSSTSSSGVITNKIKAPVKTSTTTRSSSSKSSLPTAAATTKSTTKPATKPTSSLTTSTKPKAAPFKPLKSSNVTQDKTFSNPISPPVFHAPHKTVVPLDKSKLHLGSSTETADSETEVGHKKKISAEGLSINNDIEDIPFADENEAEGKFYTPCAPDKTMNFLKSTNDIDSPDARKRILPNPPSKSAELSVLTASQIREIRRADMEKAKFQARERARLKSDEELGIAVSETPSKILSRNHVNAMNINENQSSASFDTLSASDLLSDSDDKLSSSVHSPISSAAEQETHDKSKSKGKKKHKAEKARKVKKDKKDKHKDKEADSEKKEKRKSLLALILPGKSGEKHSKDNKTSDSAASTDNTPKGSDTDNSRSKGKTPKAGHKAADVKAKAGKGTTTAADAKHDADRTPVLDYKKDLAICSIFHSENPSRPKTRLSSLSKRDVQIAPRASIDDFSDSDESHVSVSTMRRMDDDLDERVARRLRKIQLKQQKQAQQKRLRMAQEIQRQLEEVEVRQRELEERGTTVEKSLRGDGPEDEEDVDEASLMNEWFSLVHEKNALLRYESELNVRAKELELEDRHARLESEFRDRSRKAEESKTGNDIQMEGLLLDELLDVVKQRDSLVAMLEEDRLREKQEDKELKVMMTKKGYVLSPLSYDTRHDTRRDHEIAAPLASSVL